MKVNGQEHPVTHISKYQDSDWGGRSTQTLYLTMPYAEVAALLPDNTPWSIVQRDMVDVLDEQGKPTGETKEAVNEWDNSAYSLSGAITDHRDGTVSIKMGKPTETENAKATVTALAGAPDKTPALWAVIDAEHAGTQDDPIPAARGMEYEYGKYYLDGEDGKVYLCERTGEQAGGKITLQYLPHELVGNYFKAV